MVNPALGNEASMGLIRRHRSSFVKVCLCTFALYLSLSYIRSRWLRLGGYGTQFSLGTGRLLPGDNIVRKIAALDDPSLPRSNVNPQDDENCHIPHLNETRRGGEHVLCSRLKPVQGSCRIAEELFFSSPTETCDFQKHHDICKLKEVTSTQHQVVCRYRECNTGWSIGLQASSGQLQWHNFSSPSEMEDRIAEIIHPSSTSSTHHGFCFVRCTHSNKLRQLAEVDREEMARLGLGETQSDYLEHIAGNADPHVYQLLLLPPQFHSSRKKKKKHPQSSQLFNINIMLIDSVSHSHFYRSMPKTVRALKSINLKGNSQVFSYDLVQGIKDRTYESLQVLFSGQVIKGEPFGTFDMPPVKLHVEKLFLPLKKLGYRTLWLEDLCWTWEWGIIKNLLVHNTSLSQQERWDRLQDALSRAGIDALDVTYAMCKVLRENNRNDHFHGPDAVCYNGQHQHQYLVNYLMMYQRKMKLFKQPYLTYLMTNVGHEDTGRRVQTFDETLSKYLRFVAAEDNSITVIFSDHGNGYGQFVKKSMEGRIETYHPFLLFIIPEKVAKVLGPKKMAALKKNEKRLITLLDLHYTLQSLIPKKTQKTQPEHRDYQVNADGLFSTVSANRTCNNIPRLDPNLCICEGYESSFPTDMSSSQPLIAEFALGALNNVLQNQFKAAHPQASTGFGSCLRLRAQSFHNVRDTYNTQDGTYTTKMDLHIDEPGSESKEIFLVVVKTALGTDAGMTLLTFDRITAYSRFSRCADKGVNVKLCVCSLEEPIRKLDFSNPPDWLKYSKRIFDRKSEPFPVEKGQTHCLYVMTRRYSKGASFEIANVCSKGTYQVEFDLSVINMEVSSLMPLEAVLHPGEMTFLCSAVQTLVHLDWQWKYSISVSLYS